MRTAFAVRTIAMPMAAPVSRRDQATGYASVTPRHRAAASAPLQLEVTSTRADGSVPYHATSVVWKVTSARMTWPSTQGRRISPKRPAIQSSAWITNTVLGSRSAAAPAEGRVRVGTFRVGGLGEL